MADGIIHRLNRERGFGFVGQRGGTEYFFHHSGLAPGVDFNQLQVGQGVRFELAPNQRRPGTQKAIGVALVPPPAGQSPILGPHQEADNAGDAGNNNAREGGLPYDFVPIDTTRFVTDAPVWHDGSSGGDLLSGEIRCTLEALTPLLPGNARYKAAQADPNKLNAWGYVNLPDNKQIAEPLRLPDGRVVIAGSALKGMVRHSLGALLSAPMERVAEHHYTYRPNLDFNKHGVPEKYVVRPALITAGKNGGWEIEVFDNARAAIFVRGNAERDVLAAADNDGVVLAIPNVQHQQQRILAHHGGTAAFSANYRIAIYKGGIDGEGLLAQAFNPKGGTYKLALVPQDSICTLQISANLYRRYLDDQEKILSSNKIGHLTAHPLKFDVDKVARSIKDHAAFSVGQLVYVELTTDTKGKVTNNSRVLSCGRHFRYRWAYTSSVRTQAGQPRACLKPVADELKKDEEGKSAGLTAARLMFGYVKNDETEIGQGVFERMAGRIAINHALSDGVPEFLGDEGKGYCVPLKILGQPNSSAWEIYLRQPQDRKQAPETYGDLPGDPGGDLADRKLYRHQLGIQEVAHIADPTNINSDQATLARFICKPGTTFKFTIRFARLREWELGALLAVLQPHRLLKAGKPEEYAHKLGLGRPLGMGSVRMNIEKILLRKERETQLTNHQDQAIEALASDVIKNSGGFVTKLNLASDSGKRAIARRWLEIHRCTEIQTLDYPRPAVGTGDIFNWHTELRREYSKLRRQAEPNWESVSDKINKAKSGDAS